MSEQNSTTSTKPSSQHVAGGGQPGHLYLVDGSAYIFRAYHALPPLTRKSDGLPIGAVSGFCNMLSKLVDDVRNDGEVDYFAVIFDAARKTFRNDIYPEYKAHRPPPPEDLQPQFPLVKRASEAFSLATIEMPGFEADDIIATYARQAREAGMQVTIVSSDKDLMQLIGGGVVMHDPMKQRRIGPDEVYEKFGVGPDRVIDVQALCGDATDNVPGVPGIGVKTAALLINEYGDLDGVLARAEEIKQPKRRQNLIDHADLARVSRDLVTLKDDVPVEQPLDELGLREPEAEVLLDFMAEMGLERLAGRIAQRLGGEVPEAVALAEAETAPALDYQCIQTLAELESWIERARAAGVVAVDTETTSLDAMAANLVGVSLSIEPGQACYIPLGHKGPVPEGELDLGGTADTAPEQIPLDRALDLLRPLLADPSVLKIGQNLKYDMLVLRRYDIEITPLDDTMLLSYVTEGGMHGHGMDELSKLHLDIAPIPFKEVAGSGKSQITFDQVPLDKAVEYAAEDADLTLRLYRRLKPQLLVSRKTAVYETLERPLVPVLVDMEQAGILVDRAELVRLSADFAGRIVTLEGQIHELAGEAFNVNSPKQLGEILFDKMSIPGGKKTKTGAYGTGADVLEGLAAQGHDLPLRVLEYRQLAKLKSTYTDALQNQINPTTGRVHTSYAMAATSTGRLASTDPNLQNIPVRTEEGRRIRKAFIAAPGHKLLSADYSQIELRILAHIADITALREAFHDGLDIHAMTAAQVFNLPIKDMDPMIRRRAKAINFGIIYGISAFGLANNLGIERGEAQDYINAYFERYPGIRTYMEKTKESCRELGYVETIHGRRVHMPGINDKNGARRGFHERAAINAPIQGSAADVIRRAMVAMPDALAAAGLNATMLLQVHDELVFEVPEGEAEETVTVAKWVMEGAAHLSVPLVVDAGTGNSWDEAH
ncbi:MAG: DNA polymerase I [Alphaproteobacteria bacterium]|jgi:DNA polymerase-1|nr:DNA polymerase I [Alphaproteobacteria bacterium]MDP6256784.1 DNA polymerase I [Alphaproteobacteria bacterium]MDP7055911.1 DNA polymerase I [Alphaproteobacteria bacterium]MDP7229026.1 DNA polymerase I [Alphaproteobacteria bacterium]MDP7461222.1 DNA polymerase I [Alphaproteobacteria bacterium]|tara:strand:- start:890 stop:3718 length:2829 start_codon:yes stop_codon:yes gene_type:complete